MQEKLQLDLPKRPDVETVSGWLISHLGRLPRVGDEVTVANVHFEVVQVVKNRAERILITRPKAK